MPEATAHKRHLGDHRAESAGVALTSELDISFVLALARYPLAIGAWPLGQLTMVPSIQLLTCSTRTPARSHQLLPAQLERQRRQTNF